MAAAISVAAITDTAEMAEWQRFGPFFNFYFLSLNPSLQASDQQNQQPPARTPEPMMSSSGNL
nr:hypothetical protein Iba_chr10aCG15230 [Ipomoea batatas]GMD45899.1 hypothetical protein Iba_chr10dCG14440 [Ipomoea batatas]GMD48768.1 hypothetical protein Iba_chr10fCG9550 [Ipomoea batatas]